MSPCTAVDLEAAVVADLGRPDLINQPLVSLHRFATPRPSGGSVLREVEASVVTFSSLG